MDQERDPQAVTLIFGGGGEQLIYLPPQHAERLVADWQDALKTGARIARSYRAQSGALLIDLTQLAALYLPD